MFKRMFNRKKYTPRLIYLQEDDPRNVFGIKLIPVDIPYTLNARGKIYLAPMFYDEEHDGYLIKKSNVVDSKQMIKIHTSTQREIIKRGKTKQKYYYYPYKFNNQYIIYERFLDEDEGFCERCGNVSGYDMFELSQEHLAQNLCSSCFADEMHGVEREMVEEYYQNGDITKEIYNAYIIGDIPFVDVETKSGRNLDMILYG